MTTPQSAADPLPAGNFSAWLRAMRSALTGGPGMDVACGDCVGCCTSAYFIKVRATETDALRHIPAEQLRPGPHDSRFMGYDAQGHCPMFRAGGCSIYEHRPDTCRTYDCRVFAAAGMDAGEGRPVINERVARWRFDYQDESQRREHRAVTAAANFLRQHPVRFPSGHVPSRASDIAVLAVKSYTVFMNELPDGNTGAAIVDACRQFDQARRPD